MSISLARAGTRVYIITMTTTQTTKTYEMFELYTTGRWVVRCRETGTETVPMGKASAGRVLQALRKEG